MKSMFSDRSWASSTMIVEADGVADPLADVLAQLAGDALGDAAGRDAAGLGVADQARLGQPRGQQVLGDLGALAGAGLARHHQDLVRTEGRDDVVPVVRDRQHSPQAWRPSGPERC
jgi:hypothetical protein